MSLITNNAVVDCIITGDAKIAFMISNLNNLRSIFSKMKLDGWDTTNSQRWGFFFVDIEKENLQYLYEEMKDNNYKLESLSKTDDDRWQLYVSKIDILTPKKLHQRNNAFNELAAACDVELYDGWDVEKP